LPIDSNRQIHWRRLRQRLRWRNPFAIPGISKRIQRALTLFWLDGLFIGTSVSLVSNYITLYALEFGANSTQIGLITTMTSVGSVLALLPGAQLAEKWIDPKRAVLIFSRGIGQLVWAALGALPLFLSGQPAIYGVLLLRAVRAFAVSASSSAWTSLSAQIVPRFLRGKYFAARNIAKQGAALLVVPIAGWLIDRLGFPWGYQLCFALATVIGLLAYWTYARIPFEPSEDRTSVPAQQNAELGQAPVDRRNFWRFCATSVCWTFSLQFAAPFFTVYLIEELGGSAGIVGALVAVHSLTALPGQALFGRWLDRRGIKWTFRLSGLLIPFLPWAWLLVRSPWAALPVYAGTGFLFAGYDLSNFNMLLAITPREHKTRQVALYRTIVQSVAALAPLLGGLTVDWVGFLPVFAISGIGRLVSVLLLLHFVREPHPETA
jgi:MFS family permease